MADRTLTRRDALAALAAVGVTGVAAAALTWDEEGAAAGLRQHDVATLQAVARVVYPTDVDGVAAFVETYVVGRVASRPETVAGIRDAVAALDESARTWHDAPFVDLDPGTRDQLLRRTNVDAATPDPEGAERERIRYHLVNEVLYALYTSPTGGRLVGIENPQGHPGGTESYQRGPGALGDRGER